MPDFMPKPWWRSHLSIMRAGLSVIAAETSIRPFIRIFVGGRKVLVDKTLAFGRNSTLL